MDLAQTIALTMGVAWASGINLYAAILMLGLLSGSGHIDLPPDLQIISHPAVIGAAGFMYCVEFFADKVPGVDTGWDTLHTFVRIPAGAVLAATAMGSVSMEAQIAAAIIGGSLTAATHATKAGGRIMLNTSPEPFSNWTVSIAEDLAVVGGLWAAIHYPWAFIVFVVAFVALLIWLLPKLWRGVRAIGRKVGRWLGWGTPEASEAVPEHAPNAPESGTPRLEH